MKNLMAKLKGADYKGLFLRHGEKLGMGLTALLALVCLAITDWRGYADTPEQMTEQAQKVEKQLRENAWPAEKKAEFVPLTAEQAVASLQDPVNLSSFAHSVNMSPKLYTYRLPADEPVIVPVTELLVSSGQMPLDVIPPITEEPQEMAEDAYPTRGTERGVPPRDRGRDRDDRRNDRISNAPGAFPGDRAGLKTTIGNRPAATRDKLAGPAVDRLAGGKKGAGGVGGRKARDADPGDEDFSGVGNPYSSGAGGAMAAVGKARGVRYNVITGIVDRRKQLELLKNALHLETPGDAPEFLEYVDFKIQRQRALPGPKPWSDDPKSWKDLDTNHSIDLLTNEAVDFDPDVVAAEYINDAITSPLPHRLDGDWDFAEVGHPRIPALDMESRQMEAFVNLNAAQILIDAEIEEEEARFTRGFRRAQKDPTRMRQQAMRVDGGGEQMRSAMSRMTDTSGDDDEDKRGRGRFRVNPGMSRGNAPMARGGGPGAMPPRGGVPSRNFDPTMQGRSRMMAGMPGMAGGAVAGDEYFSSGVGGVGGSTVADTILFRYFDFDIEPGECYRYRVQVVINNPSEDVEFVSSPEVAVGHDRSSTWSAPSPLVIVPRDVEYSLARIRRIAGRREGAVLSVVQFDTDAGTLVADNLPLRYGEYVGGTRKTDHLNLAAPSFLPEDVTFASKEILVDSAGAPVISSSVLSDLKLSPKQAQRLTEGGGFDQAVTLNRFGELVPLNANPRVDYDHARMRYDEQAREYADLKEESTAEAAAAKLNSRDMLAQMAGDEDMPSGRRGVGLNPLKVRGGRNASERMGGMNPNQGRRGGNVSRMEDK